MKIVTFATATCLSLVLCVSAQAADTKSIVKSAMTELVINKNVDAIDTYFSEPYIQHNQSVPTGLKAFKGLAGQVIAANPAFKYKMIRLFADGDIGIAHGIYEGFGEVPLVGFDVFRVANGKIVEHWDNLSPLAPNNPSDRSQIDGSVEVKDPDNTDTNKSLVTKFMKDVLIGGAFDQLPNFFDGDTYVQHNSNIADGLSGLSAGLSAMADSGLAMRITKLHKIYGEGNFVLALSEGSIANKATAFYDLFRVENGKIAEHWDVISSILADDKAANTNGKF